MRRLIIISLWVVGCGLLSQGIYMDAKAKLAQWLIASSWENRSQNSPATKPWWWADTKVIARLDAPRLNKTLYVMQNDSGESLAFGPGHMPASAKPSSNGHVVIAGHRDSHFAFLKEIQVGDVLSTDNQHSVKVQYRVTDIEIIDSSKQEIDLFNHSHLTLVTCYPFDSVVPGGPLRFIVHAEPVEPTQLAVSTATPETQKGIN